MSWEGKKDEQLNRAIRLSSMALVLLAGGELTASDIARRWKVGRRTAQRDMLAMEQIIPVVIGSKRLGAWTVRAVKPCLSDVEVVL